MKLTRFLPGYLEAFSLLGLAGFLAYLLVLGNYWMYLNPKFQGLSWLSAAALAGLGCYSLARPPAGSTWFRAGVSFSVLLLCLFSEVGVERWLTKSGVNTGALIPQEASLPSRVSVAGKEYIRINLGELYDLAAKQSPEILAQRYAMRGFVRRSPGADARGEFVLYRVAMYCCYADSTAVGLRVRPPEGESLPKDGSWLVAYGKLTASQEDPEPALTSIGGSAFASIQKEYALDATRLEPATAPGMGMLYEFRSQEPYAF